MKRSKKTSENHGISIFSQPQRLPLLTTGITFIFGSFMTHFNPILKQNTPIDKKDDRNIIRRSNLSGRTYDGNNITLPSLAKANEYFLNFPEINDSMSDSPGDLETMIMEQGVVFKNETLAPPIPGTMTARLPNLGSTSYLNVILQTIANLDCFDKLLNREIAFLPPLRDADEDDMSYDKSCTEALSDFNLQLPKKILLQTHLRSLIMRMRQAGNACIDKYALEELFHYLRENGWNTIVSKQHDPHKLLTFLLQTFCCREKMLESVEQYSYYKGDTFKEFTVKSSLNELPLPLPVTDQNRFDKKYISLEGLFENYQNQSMANCIPPGEESQFTLEKRTFLIGQPPQTLFIQLKRFGPDEESFRISGEVPLEATMNIPFYNPQNFNPVPEVSTYELKLAICHDPEGGHSADSGRYTISIHQKSLLGSAQLLHYDDLNTIQTQLCSSLNKQAVRRLRENSYYLAYTLLKPGQRPIRWRFEAVPRANNTELITADWNNADLFPLSVYLASQNWFRPKQTESRNIISKDNNIDKKAEDDPELIFSDSSGSTEKLDEEEYAGSDADNDIIFDEASPEVSKGISWPADLKISPKFQDFLKFAVEDPLSEDLFNMRLRNDDPNHTFLEDIKRIVRSLKSGGPVLNTQLQAFELLFTVHGLNTDAEPFDLYFALLTKLQAESS